MKISNNNVGSSQLQNLDATKDRVDISSRNAKKSDALSGDLQSSAKVNLSERAQDIKKIREVALASPDVDEEKVARLQKMIDEGSYKINADEIADSMVDEHLMMS